nr:integrase, catalytic region, zinc finger, CCHC-type, peptidase aspartic, catalytic [Tanacetum cinerariifolium]GEY48528.1 integrase, catalytic region, zinc finger, CCHC-type, peptidase aspartic, catalytic [Tanacetum cinerariifolium]
MKQAVILREIVKQANSLNLLDSASYSTCKLVKLIQELLGYVIDTCLDIHKPSEKLVNVTPINKTMVRCSKHMTGDHSQLTKFVHKFLDTVKFGNDQIADIMRYGDYQMGNITISRVYYVDGQGHNLFFIG